MAEATRRLKQGKEIATARPTGRAIDIERGLKRVMERYPRIMARLGE